VRKQGKIALIEAVKDGFDVHRIINFSILFVPRGGSKILIKSVGQFGIG